MQVTGSATDLRRHNRDAVLGLIKTQGAISRTEIAQRVGLCQLGVFERSGETWVGLGLGGHAMRVKSVRLAFVATALAL